MQQQAPIKQQRIAAPITVIAFVVDIPPISPASSTKISNSASSSIFVAAAMSKLIFKFCDGSLVVISFKKKELLGDANLLFDHYPKIPVILLTICICSKIFN